MAIVTRTQHRGAVFGPDLSGRTNMVDVAMSQSDRYGNQVMGSQGISKELFSTHARVDDDALRPLFAR
ncbi:hypothetical protein HMPREF9607_02475 [Cutibacterium modestum HL044PA1]|uniref:Uncharacterized protein n=1 Tax=Cutibacterium modestum HL044PA1 TaxID=765109 RepID=A0ABN0C254_9ACTN|nr:hypothetical protein HMPREF9607_02475 [Cutibacterium modestum HL044PA1]